jgi:3-oxoacyl-[acyl-carrier protein] reductase
VINIGSGSSRICAPNHSIYAASKAALDAVTAVLAKELATRRIRVNSVNPGATLSEGAQAAGVLGNGGEVEKQLIAMTPLGRIGKSSDIGKVVAFLPSTDSDWLTRRNNSGVWRLTVTAYFNRGVENAPPHLDRGLDNCGLHGSRE